MDGVHESALNQIWFFMRRKVKNLRALFTHEKIIRSPCTYQTLLCCGCVVITVVVVANMCLDVYEGFASASGRANLFCACFSFICMLCSCSDKGHYNSGVWIGKICETTRIICYLHSKSIPMASGNRGHVFQVTEVTWNLSAVITGLIFSPSASHTLMFLRNCLLLMWGSTMFHGQVWW